MSFQTTHRAGMRPVRMGMRPAAPTYVVKQQHPNDILLARLLIKRQRRGLHPKEQMQLRRLALWHHAKANPILGIAIGSKQRQAKAVGKATLYRNQYLNCRGRQKKKGKPYYPDDESTKKCRGQYKKWNKWRGKAGKRADKYLGKLDKKGRLTEEAQAALQADIDLAEMEALKESKYTVTKPGQKDSGDEFPEEFYDAEGYVIEESDLDGPSTPWGLIVGGVAVVGLIGILAMR